MKRQFVNTRLWACVFLSLLLFGCGYSLAPDSPSLLGDGTKTLKIKEIDSPTMHPWLPFALRSALRDEINARSLAQWVDSGEADYQLQINVISFTSREWGRTEEFSTMMYASTLTIEGIIYQGGKEIWRSNHLSYSDNTEAVDEKTLINDSITHVVRKLADQIRATF